MIAKTLLTLGLIAIAGTAFAQMPGERATGNPKGVTNPQASAAEASAKAQIEAAGFTSVSSLTRQSDGTWTGTAMKNNVEIAVSVDVGGNIAFQ